MSLPKVHGYAHINPNTYAHFLDIVFLENLKFFSLNRKILNQKYKISSYVCKQAAYSNVFTRSLKPVSCSKVLLNSTG